MLLFLFIGFTSFAACTISHRKSDPFRSLYFSRWLFTKDATYSLNLGRLSGILHVASTPSSIALHLEDTSLSSFNVLETIPIPIANLNDSSTLSGICFDPAFTSSANVSSNSDFPVPVSPERMTFCPAPRHCRMKRSLTVKSGVKTYLRPSSSSFAFFVPNASFTRP